MAVLSSLAESFRSSAVPAARRRRVLSRPRALCPTNIIRIMQASLALILFGIRETRIAPTYSNTADANTYCGHTSAGGVLVPNKSIRIKDITDGLTSTLLLVDVQPHPAH